MQYSKHKLGLILIGGIRLKIANVSGNLLWKPSREIQEKSNIKKFMTWLDETRGLKFEHYNQLWEWSVTDLEGFWSAIWDYYKINTKSHYHEVLSEGKMPDVEWFSGATVNYAE